MNLTPEQQKELERFPQVLRALIEAELHAGNTIAEVGHSFPAPPAGAYFKFTRKVTTRPRASGDGLDFRERNSSISSGEFTDAKRFFFIVEPPDPPPPEPDMDAIRKSLEPKPDPLSILAERAAGSLLWTSMDENQGKGQTKPRSKRSRKTSSPHPETPALGVANTYQATRSPAGVDLRFHFKDIRPPQEVQFHLEKQIGSLFTLSMENRMLVFRSRADVIGVVYTLEMRFTGSLQRKNHFTLHAEASWGGESAPNREYYRNTAEGWFQMWIRGLTPAPPPKPGEGVGESYLEACEIAIHAEDHLKSVEAIQQAILDGMYKGGRYSTSHKEGGTHICWRIDRFIRSDYGDYPDHQNYQDPGEFLKALRQFFHWDIQRYAGKTPFSEIEVWKLLLRRMSPG